MRHFGSVVRTDLVDVIQRGYDRAMSRIIASEFVGDQPPWFAALTFDQATEKPFSCPLVAAPLYQDINHIAVLIDGTPQILPLPLNRNKHFVDVPRVA